MREPVYYIAGKMRGTPDLGRAHFNAVEAKLRARGAKVLNPAILPVDLPDEVYMPICLAMLREADIVVLLDGWEDSQGAGLEKRYAEMCGKFMIPEECIGYEAN